MYSLFFFFSDDGILLRKVRFSIDSLVIYLQGPLIRSEKTNVHFVKSIFLITTASPSLLLDCRQMDWISVLTELRGLTSPESFFLR